MRAQKQVWLPEQHLLCIVVLFILLCAVASARSVAAAQEIRRGFSVKHDASVSSFQSLLADPSGVFSLGFLRVDSSQLDLAVVHLPSSFPVWRAIPARSPDWSVSATLSFNGSLVLSNAEKGVLWSSSGGDGDSVVVLNSSNLQVQKLEGGSTAVLWQSFDFPSDTLVQGQNFTSSAALFSSNQRFSMRLGEDYFAMYMELSGGTTPMYWKHTALQANTRIVEGQGAVYARVEPNGFLGMYQGNETTPAEVLSFDSFNRGIEEFRRMTLESDGNLRAYYWHNSTWKGDYTAITDTCELPAICGTYGLCRPEGEPRCRCLEDGRAGTCNLAEEKPGDICGGGSDGFQVLRPKGVDLANKELVPFAKVGSLEECERSCEQNCTCWGTVYNNASGYCYRLDYPIQTLVASDERKLAYFKVSNRALEKDDSGRSKTKAALLVVGLAILCGAALFTVLMARNWRKLSRGRGVEGSTAEEGLSQGPYKNLGSASFRSIELSNSFKK